MDGKDDELRSYFDACDTNQDGKIQYPEFVTLLHNIGADMEEDEYRIGFSEVDVDSDGVIDFSEFVEWWREH